LIFTQKVIRSQKNDENHSAKNNNDYVFNNGGEISLQGAVFSDDYFYSDAFGIETPL
jgi:hypothetical protein